MRTPSDQEKERVLERTCVCSGEDLGEGACHKSPSMVQSSANLNDDPSDRVKDGLDNYTDRAHYVSVYGTNEANEEESVDMRRKTSIDVGADSIDFGAGSAHLLCELDRAFNRLLDDGKPEPRSPIEREEKDYEKLNVTRLLGEVGLG